MDSWHKRIKVEEFKKKIGLNEDLEIKDGDSGVYIIYSVSTEWCYIGETGNLKKRFKKNHLTCLRNGKHNRYKLQQIYDEFGEDDLVYIPVYKCPEFMRKDVERAYTYKLGLKSVNVDSPAKGFNWEIMNREKTMMDRIPNKYRIILKTHKEWKYKYCDMYYSDYLSTMLKSGVEVSESGFKWVDEIESSNNLKFIKRFSNEYNDFTQVSLDYIAIAILNDILGKEDDSDVLCKKRIREEFDFESDDLIYNIYKQLRKDDTFRNDIIRAAIAMISYKYKKYNCILEETELFLNDLQMKNAFDLLYVYIIYLIINGIMYY